MRLTTKVAVAGAAQVAVAFGLARYAYGLFLPQIGEDFQLPLPVLGTIAGASYGCYLAGVVLAGALVARLGPRVPILLGGCSAAIGLFTAAQAQDVGVLAFGVILAGSSAGWAWAPYSDVVKQASTEMRTRGHVLSVISTGTSFGLVFVAIVVFTGSAQSWRVLWSGFAVVALLATALNAWVVPRRSDTTNTTKRQARRAGKSPGVLAPLRRPSARLPICFAFAYSGSGAVYFTYAASLARSAGLAMDSSAAIYLIIGGAGFVALFTRQLVQQLGILWVATLGVTSIGAGLGSLALGAHALPAAICSAILFGAGYMTCAAVLSLWTAEEFSELPSAGLTIGILFGGSSSIVSPILAGWVAARISLSFTLLLFTGVAAVGAAGIGIEAFRSRARRTVGDQSNDRRARAMPEGR